MERKYQRITCSWNGKMWTFQSGINKNCPIKRTDIKGVPKKKVLILEVPKFPIQLVSKNQKASSPIMAISCERALLRIELLNSVYGLYPEVNSAFNQYVNGYPQYPASFGLSCAQWPQGKYSIGLESDWRGDFMRIYLQKRTYADFPIGIVNLSAVFMFESMHIRSGGGFTYYNQDIRMREMNEQNFDPFIAVFYEENKTSAAVEAFKLRSWQLAMKWLPHMAFIRSVDQVNFGGRDSTSTTDKAVTDMRNALAKLPLQ